jgi:enterochelin esterase-like enzyme
MRMKGDPGRASAAVGHTGEVTFRLNVPKAKAVTLCGDWMARGAHEPVARRKKGEWSITLGPLAPGPYLYSFAVDGVAQAASLVEVPGDGTEFYASKPVPHGALHKHSYLSRTLASTRRLVVYTPPGYEEDTRTRYPVLYLLHGTGDNEESWTAAGRAHLILDNLLSEGKASPMIVVMPYGHAGDPRLRDPASSARNVALFAGDLLLDVLPLAEGAYRVEAEPERRAIAGLSLGGVQALHVGLHNLDRFAWIGVFSAGAGMRSNPAGDFEREFAPVLSGSEQVNRNLRLLWIGCGDADFHYPAARLLRGLLYKYGTTNTFRRTGGGHTWRNWRLYLSEFAALLFR